MVEWLWMIWISRRFGRCCSATHKLIFLIRNFNKDSARVNKHPDLFKLTDAA
jgi:hypothetical protein